ncbi:MAG: DoxX family protein [Alphaproteobacteria bacterium]|nr:DoxX family protein [Alphaproteobacteria bacterium]
MTKNLKTCAHKIICKFNCVLTAFTPLVNLVARFYVANIFFKSGLTKIDNWSATLYLFQHEYKVPVLSFGIAAFIATFVELVGSVALALGVGTRYAAIALFLMTLVMNFTYQELPENYYWMIILAMIMVQGGKRISIDYLIKIRCCNGHGVVPCCDKSCSHGFKPSDKVQNLTLEVKAPKKKATTKKKTTTKKKK